jgi:hypothetical protein
MSITPVFTTTDELLAFAAKANPSELRIEPHHSASYLWRVIHPASFDFLSYGFSTNEALLAWANEAFPSPPSATTVMPVLQSDTDFEIEFEDRPLLLIAARVNQFLKDSGTYDEFEIEEIVGGLEMSKLVCFKGWLML